MQQIPPDDPEDWSDEEWLAWLAETDESFEAEKVAPAPVRARSFGSHLLYAGMFGLHQAIYGTRQEITIVAEADGQPDDPEGLEVHLSPDHPEDSTVTLRPWLMRSQED